MMRLRKEYEKLQKKDVKSIPLFVERFDKISADLGAAGEKILDQSHRHAIKLLMFLEGS